VVHLDFKKSLVKVSSIALIRLSHMPVGHSIKKGSHVAKVGFSMTYSGFSYMLTGKMKWVTLAIALYIYTAIKMAKSNREMMRQSDDLVPLPVEPITPIHLPETIRSSLPPVINLPPQVVISPANTVQQANLPGAGLFEFNEERREYLAARR